MKTYELHLVNRIYISNAPKKNIFSLDEHEDVIEPFKIQEILNQLSDIQWDPLHHMYILKCRVPKVYPYGMCREYFYMMTNSMNVFTLPEKEEDLYEWLINHWEDKFLITFPIYSYQDKTYTFNIQEITFEAQKDIDIHTMIQKKQYTIGNGLILLLSLNKWSNDSLLNAIQRLFLVRSKFETIKLFWMPYYNVNSLLLTDYLIFYAFQHATQEIYRLIYDFECDNHYNYYNYRIPLCMYMNANYTKNYVCSLSTVHTSPTYEHYCFLKEIHQNKMFDILNGYPQFHIFHYDIHSRLKQVFSSTSLIRDFLGKGLTYRWFVHSIYVNKKLGILKLIQSLSFFYTQTTVSKRFIKYVWRLFMKEFPKEFIYILCGYTIECIIYHYSRPITYHLNIPPMKLFRDTLFLLKDYIKCKKMYKIVFYIHSDRLYKVPDCLMPFKISCSSKHSMFHLTFFDVLKLMDAPIYKTLQKRKQVILNSLYHSNYNLYTILRTYYQQYPDELWQRDIEISI